MIDYTVRCKNGFFSSGEAIRIVINQGKYSVATKHSHFGGDIDDIIELTATRQLKMSPVGEALGDCDKSSNVVNQGNAGQSISSEVTRKENAMKEANEIREQKEVKTDPTRKTTRKR